MVWERKLSELGSTETKETDIVKIETLFMMVTLLGGHMAKD